MRSLLRLPSDYGLLLWIFVLWGTPFYGATAHCWSNLAILALALPVWYRQAAALPRTKADTTAVLWVTCQGCSTSSTSAI